MRVVGAVAILIAVLLAWAAFNNYSDARSIRNAIGNQRGLVWIAGEGLGLNEIDRIRIEQSEGTAWKFGVGATAFLLIGVALCSGGRSDRDRWE